MATQEVEALLAEPGTRIHTFRSRHAGLRLIRRPEVKMPNPMGQQMHMQSALRYEFKAGICTVEEGEDLAPTGPRGEEEDALQWLRRHPQLNLSFWEDGREPQRPLPTDQQMLDRVMRAVADMNPHRLMRLIEQEERRHGRPTVLAVAKHSLATVIQRFGGSLPEETDEQREERETMEAAEAAELEREEALLAPGGATLAIQATLKAAEANAAALASTMSAKDDLVDGKPAR